MDPISLSSAVVAVLAPFLSKGAEEFTKAAGKSAGEAVSAMLGKLKSRWLGDAEAKGTLDAFEQKPERHRATLNEVLAERLASDGELKQSLTGMLDSLGPQLQVIQKMDRGTDVTGVKAAELNAGRVEVSQTIKQGERIVGADIGKIGDA